MLVIRKVSYIYLVIFCSMGRIIPIIKRKRTLDIAKLASGINLFAHCGMTKLTEYKLLVGFL